MSDFQRVTDFPATDLVAGTDLLYSAKGDTDAEQKTTVNQLQFFVLSPISGSTATDAGALTGTETIPMGRNGLVQTSLAKILAYVASNGGGGPLIVSGTPSNNLGLAGQVAIDPVAGMIYGPKTTVWPAGLAFNLSKLSTAAQASLNAVLASAQTYQTQAATSAAAAANTATGVMAQATAIANQASVVASAGGIYATTALGLAATTTGKYFWIPSAVAGQALALYQNVSGVATLISNIPNLSGAGSALLTTTSTFPTVRPSLLLDFSRSEAIGQAFVTRTDAYAFTVNQVGGLVTVGANLPRFDHNTVTYLSTGVLLEDAYINSMSYSEDFTNGIFTAAAAGTTLTAPNSSLVLTKLIPDTTTGLHYVRKTVNGNITTGNTWYVAFYAMAAEYTKLTLSFLPFTCFPNSATYLTIDFSTGVASNVGKDIVSYNLEQHAGGLWRVTLQLAKASNNANAQIQYQILDASANTSFTGTGVGGLYLGGFMARGSATVDVRYRDQSHVMLTPTITAGRDADVMQISLAAGAPWLNSIEGTWVIEHDAIAGTPLLQTNGVTFLTSVGAGRTAMAYSGGTVTVVNAGVASAATVTAAPVYGSSIVVIPTGRIRAHVLRIIFYPKALTVAQMQVLTAA